MQGCSLYPRPTLLQHHPQPPRPTPIFLPSHSEMSTGGREEASPGSARTWDWSRPLGLIAYPGCPEPFASFLSPGLGGSHPTNVCKVLCGPPSRAPSGRIFEHRQEMSWLGAQGAWGGGGIIQSSCIAIRGPLPCPLPEPPQLQAPRGPSPGTSGEWWVESR